MSTQPVTTPTSTGNCVFCQTEVAKNKMTQHLKFCKQRRATIAKQEEAPTQPKAKLFHILAEGQYAPQYWLHFEMPASEPLWSLDAFLKDMWVDDLDHLSGFTINGTSYSVDVDDMEPIFVLNGSEHSAAQKEEEIAEADELSPQKEAEEIRKIVEEIIELYSEAPMPVLDRNGVLIVEQRSIEEEWITEVKKYRSFDELIDFLKVEQANLEKEDKATWKEMRSKDKVTLKKEQVVILNRLHTLDRKAAIVKALLVAVEDRSMDVLLGRALKVGQKFEYIYDYGSSTYVTLKVLAEREGIIPDKADVQLLAQNTAPTFNCIICGKSAEQIEMDYPYRAYCDSCVEQQDDVDEERLLPIINSPRVGVL